MRGSLRAWFFVPGLRFERLRAAFVRTIAHVVMRGELPRSRAFADTWPATIDGELERIARELAGASGPKSALVAALPLAG